MIQETKREPKVSNFQNSPRWHPSHWPKDIPLGSTFLRFHYLPVVLPSATLGTKPWTQVSLEDAYPEHSIDLDPISKLGKLPFTRAYYLFEDPITSCCAPAPNFRAPWFPLHNCPDSILPILFVLHNNASFLDPCFHFLSFLTLSKTKLLSLRLESRYLTTS